MERSGFLSTVSLHLRPPLVSLSSDPYPPDVLGLAHGTAAMVAASVRMQHRLLRMDLGTCRPPEAAPLSLYSALASEWAMRLLVRWQVGNSAAHSHGRLQQRLRAPLRFFSLLIRPVQTAWLLSPGLSERLGVFFPSMAQR